MCVCVSVPYTLLGPNGISLSDIRHRQHGDADADYFVASLQPTRSLLCNSSIHIDCFVLLVPTLNESPNTPRSMSSCQHISIHSTFASCAWHFHLGAAFNCVACLTICIFPCLPKCYCCLSSLSPSEPTIRNVCLCNCLRHFKLFSSVGFPNVLGISQFRLR